MIKLRHEFRVVTRPKAPEVSKNTLYMHTYMHTTAKLSLPIRNESSKAACLGVRESSMYVHTKHCMANSSLIAICACVCVRARVLRMHACMYGHTSRRRASVV